MTDTPLAAAVAAVLDEVEAATTEKVGLVADLARTEARLGALSRSAREMIDCLPLSERFPHRLRLDRARMAEARALGPDGHGPLADRVVRLLATHPRARISSAEVRRHLTALCGPVSAGTVSRILARKAEQGVVERTGRGRYRIRRDHPMLTVHGG